MMKNVIYLYVLCAALGCQNTPSDESVDKAAIINTLKKETQYFCERNLAQWQLQWSRQPFTYKMYAGKNNFEEFVGWEAINEFTMQHIADHPAIIPLPDTNFDYEIFLFDDTAWVLYSKNVENTIARETRFMIKENNQWKISRMQTIF